eukprot:5856300-Pleurochrysis_carterae.AAC.1
MAVSIPRNGDLKFRYHMLFTSQVVSLDFYVHITSNVRERACMSRSVVIYALPAIHAARNLLQYAATMKRFPASVARFACSRLL